MWRLDNILVHSKELICREGSFKMMAWSLIHEEDFRASLAVLVFYITLYLFSYSMRWTQSLDQRWPFCSPKVRVCSPHDTNLNPNLNPYTILSYPYLSHPTSNPNNNPNPNPRHNPNSVGLTNLFIEFGQENGKITLKFKAKEKK